MAKYRITAPDGNAYDITAPDSASQDQVLAYAKSNYKAAPAVNPIKQAWNNYKSSPQYSTSPMGMLNKVPDLLSKAADKGGEFASEWLGGSVTAPKIIGGGTRVNPNPIDPRAAAIVGTAIAMGPDIAMSAGPEESKAADVTEAAVPSARRAVGFTKRQLKTPWARQTANDAGRAALSGNVIPASGSPEAMMDRAQELQEKGKQAMNDVFQRAYGYVEGKNPFTRKSAAGPSEVINAEGAIGPRLGARQPALPLKTPQPAGQNLPGPAQAPGTPPELPPGAHPGEDLSDATVFERVHKFIDPKKMISSISGLRPKFRGGHWDADHQLIDQAVSTIRGAGPGPMTLEDANAIKSRLQSVAPYGTPGHDLAKKIANRVLNVVDGSLDEFATKIGDPFLSAQFKMAKKTYGNAARMMQGLDNKLSSDWGNMPVSLPSIGVGSAEIASGRPIKGLMTMGGAELIKRRGAALAAREINAAGKFPFHRFGRLANPLLRKKKEQSDDTP